MADMIRFESRFDLSLPVALAPMALAGGGALAAACAQAGTLGLVGGGYGDLDWLRPQWQAAVDAAGDAVCRLGCGFISWRLDQDDRALTWLLDQPARPAALLLSFGDPGRHAARIRAAGVPLIVQVQALAEVLPAVDAGASVIVVQGQEAGGHGTAAPHGRGTLALVPEAADLLNARAPDVLLLAAGGVADGRGLAAVQALGAEGALIGTRLWATREALVPAAGHAAALAASGDDTVRSSVFDILRRKNWPAQFDFRALNNDIHRQWHARLPELAADPAAARADYDAGVAAQDTRRMHVTVGEAVGLVRDVPDAASLIARIAAEWHTARARLSV
jgi:nitronate monooxygenase